jgi:urease accessory protein
MRTATAVMEKGRWDRKRCTASVLLTFHDRYRRRIVMKDDNGEEFRLDLAQATVLQDGDGLLIEGGGIIEVHAAAEDVADIHAATPAAIARLAWHIGNRHTPIQILANSGLRIRYDPVLVEMIEGLGGRVTRRVASFSPEKGAYAKAGSYGHDHGPERDHAGGHHHHD